MFDANISNVTLFFSIAGICVFFVIIWIYNSESRTRTYKAELKRLREKSKSLERDRFMLLENVNSLETEPDTPFGESLKSENKKLKEELEEARNSLEDIYSALVEKEKRKTDDKKTARA